MKSLAGPLIACVVLDRLFSVCSVLLTHFIVDLLLFFDCYFRSWFLHPLYFRLYLLFFFFRVIGFWLVSLLLGLIEKVFNNSTWALGALLAFIFFFDHFWCAFCLHYGPYSKWNIIFFWGVWLGVEVFFDFAFNFCDWSFLCLIFFILFVAVRGWLDTWVLRDLYQLWM